MSPHQWLGIVAVIVVVGFLVFAFRQGQRVKRGDQHETSAGDGYGAFDGDGSSGSGSDHAA
jgi:hypothetical protein